MSLVKNLIPIAFFSLCVSCQTQKPAELITSLHKIPEPSNLSQILPRESLLYAANNSIGYFYKDNVQHLFNFPKTIIEEYMDGDHKVIKAR